MPGLHTRHKERQTQGVEGRLDEELSEGEKQLVLSGRAYWKAGGNCAAGAAQLESCAMIYFMCTVWSGNMTA